MSTLTDDDLTRLLDEAGDSYPVPEHGPDEILAALRDEPVRIPLARRRWVQLSAAATLITAGLLYVGAQSGTSNSTSEMRASRTDGLTYAKTPDRAGAPGLAPAGTVAGSTGQQTYTSMAGDAAQPQLKALRDARTVAGSGGVAVPAPAPATGGTVTAPQVGGPPSDEGDSRVIKSGSISLVVKDKRVTPTLTAIGNAAKAQGGYIAASTTDEYGDNPSGEVTLRVPVARFEDLVATIRGLDAKVRTASMSGKDVTAQYADLESQLRTLKATRERFLLILSKANTIGEILTVQQRVDGVSGQIDRIEGQRKLLGNQSELSTLTVSVSEAGDPVIKVTQKPRSGLVQAFSDAKDGFVGGVEAIIRNSGGFLLFLICLAVVLVIGRSGWRLARRRMV